MKSYTIRNISNVLYNKKLCYTIRNTKNFTVRIAKMKKYTKKLPTRKAYTMRNLKKKKIKL